MGDDDWGGVITVALVCFLLGMVFMGRLMDENNEQLRQTALALNETLTQYKINCNLCDRCTERQANMGTFYPSGTLLSNAGYNESMQLCSVCYGELSYMVSGGGDSAMLLR